ncbi:MAG: DUF3124 domain-containing protein, partial [Dinoroseobacter sp.]|nr:DUF3124 domain-containing protein [Dinoroseobacter sp.]
MMPFLSRHALPCLLAGAVFAIAPSHGTADTEDRATAQTLYVPSYSRVLTNDGDSQPLASTLVVHNVDAEHWIEITR